MRLELGQCYLDREGRVRGPLTASTAPSAAQGFLFRDGWRSWKINGDFRVYGGQRWSGNEWSRRFDLVCRVYDKGPSAVTRGRALKLLCGTHEAARAGCNPDACYSDRQACGRAHGIARAESL